VSVAVLMAQVMYHSREVISLIAQETVAFNVTNLTFKMSDMSEFGFDNVTQKC
jgi:hypothetical protein